MDAESSNVFALDPAPDAIEFRHLRSFVAVAEELNFSRAATRLYLSQPALSRQIRALERLMSCELFRRSTRRVELTLAGEALLTHARTVLEEIDRAVNKTRAVGGELTRRMNDYWAPIDPSTLIADVRKFRELTEEALAQLPTDEGATVRPVNINGVPGFVIGPAGVAPTVLYLHGGGYVSGSAFGYRSLVSAISTSAGTGILVPDYRLAPEHAFPAAVEDAQIAYEWLLESGLGANEITVVGDSSGGGLALTLLLAPSRARNPATGRCRTDLPLGESRRR